MGSAPLDDGRSRRTVSGDDARRWLGTWGAHIDAEGPLRLHADALVAPGLQIARFWHTAGRVTVPRDGRAAAVIPLHGRLRLEAGGRAIGELADGALGVSGGGLDHVLVTETPASWIGIRMDAPLGAGLLAPDEAAVLDDPDLLPAVAAQMVNTLLTRPSVPSPTSIAHLQLALHAVLDGAAVSARHREVHQATGMVVGRTRSTPDEALLAIRAHAARHSMTLQEVAVEIIARRLDVTPDERDRTLDEGPRPLRGR